MGCWGITSFESDKGLDTIGLLREKLPKDGKLELGKLIEELYKDPWYEPSDVNEGVSHTSPMALAEIMVKFLDGEAGSMDYDEEGNADDNKFKSINSFLASKESINWLRGYISDTLHHAKENETADAVCGWKWGGWFEEKNWIGWQRHMETLVNRLDELLILPGDNVELVSIETQENSLIMGQAIEG